MLTICTFNLVLFAVTNCSAAITSLVLPAPVPSSTFSPTSRTAGATPWSV